VIAHWLACKARAKDSYTRGDKCMHAWVLNSGVIKFHRGRTYKISFFFFSEKMNIYVVYYILAPESWLVWYIYIPVVFCDQIVFFTTTSSSSYMVPHRGILFCFQRKEQGAYAFIFFSSFKAYPWLLCKTQELEVRGIIIGVEYTKLYSFDGFILMQHQFSTALPFIGLHAWVCYLL